MDNKQRFKKIMEQATSADLISLLDSLKNEKLKKELEKERQEREAQELVDWARDPRNATLDWGY